MHFNSATMTSAEWRELTLQQENAKRIAFAEPIHIGKVGPRLHRHLERHASLSGSTSAEELKVGDINVLTN